MHTVIVIILILKILRLYIKNNCVNIYSGEILCKKDKYILIKD